MTGMVETLHSVLSYQRVIDTWNAMISKKSAAFNPSEELKKTKLVEIVEKTCGFLERGKSTSKKEDIH